MINFELKRLAAKGKKTFMANLADTVRATLALTAKEEKKKKFEERSKERGKEQEKDKKNSQEKGKEQGKDEEKEMAVKVLSAAEKIIVVEDAIRVLKEHIPRSSPCWANVEWLRVFRKVAMLTLPLTTTSSMA